MKKLCLFFLFIAVQQIGFSQLVPHHFSIVNNRVTWEKVFQEEYISFEDLVNTLKSQEPLTDFTIQDHRITLFSKRIPIHLGLIPKPYNEFPSKYASYGFKGYFVIDYKDGRFRVTLTNIQVETERNPTGDPIIAPLEYFAVQTSRDIDTLAKKFVQQESHILNFTLIDLFKILKVKDANW